MPPPRLQLFSRYLCNACKGQTTVLRPSRQYPSISPQRNLSTSVPRAAASGSSASKTPFDTDQQDTESSSLDLEQLATMFSTGEADAHGNDPTARYADELQRGPQPYRLHVWATKHNTHITLTRPAPRPPKYDPQEMYKPPPPNQPVLSYAAGNIGFRKAGRGTYDAAYQLASFVFKQIQERGLLAKVKQLEVVLRDFGAGREAVTKAILGQEGRILRSRIVAVTDATRLKFGGSRSPNPRRLG